MFAFLSTFQIDKTNFQTKKQKIQNKTLTKPDGFRQKFKTAFVYVKEFL